MDFKRVRELLQQYYFKNGEAVGFGQSIIKDEVLAAEIEVAWRLNEAANARIKKMNDDIQASVTLAISKGIKVENIPPVPKTDEVITQIISEYGLGGIETVNSNSQAIKKIMESDGHVEFNLNSDAYNVNFLTSSNKSLGMAALKYLARKQEYDIVNLNVTEELIDPENGIYKIVVDFEKKPIIKIQEEPVQPVVQNPDPQPVIVDVPEEPPFPIEPDIDQQQEPPIQPLDSVAPDYVQPEQQEEKPKQSFLGRIAKLYQDVQKAHQANVKAKKNAAIEASIDIEFVLNAIKEATSIEGPDSPTASHWKNVFCLKTGKDIAYLEQLIKDLEQIDSLLKEAEEMQSEERIERYEEMKALLLQNANNPIPETNNSTPIKKDSPVDQSVINTSTAKESQVKADSTPKDPTIGILGVNFDKVIEDLCTALYYKNLDDIAQLISKIKINFPQPTVRKYIGCIQTQVDTDNRELLFAYLDCLTASIPGREDALAAKEKELENKIVSAATQVENSQQFDLVDLINSLEAAINEGNQSKVEETLDLIEIMYPDSPSTLAYAKKLEVAINTKDAEAISNMLACLKLSQPGNEEALNAKEQELFGSFATGSFGGGSIFSKR